MQVTMIIDKAEVMAEVSKTSAYIGAKTITQDGGNLYNNISTIKEDAEMLQRYWDEACSNVASAGKEFVAAVGSGDAQWTLTLEMPEKYNDALTGVLAQRVFSYVVRYILANWLLLCGFGASVVEVYRQDALSLLAAVQDTLYARRFTRPVDDAEGDNAIGGDTPQNLGPVRAVIIERT